MSLLNRYKLITRITGAAVVLFAAIAMFAWNRNDDSDAVEAPLASSPAVPSSKPSIRCGKHPWCNPQLSVDERTRLLMARMNILDKATMMSTAGFPAQYQFGGIARLGIPPIVFRNGPAGIKSALFVGVPATQLPIPLLSAASFDPAITAMAGNLVGTEAVQLGFDALLGPSTDLMRLELNGRSFESFGEDPLLQSRMVVPFIRMVQSHNVPTVLKHFIANNQEGVSLLPEGVSLPFPIGVSVSGTRHLVNSIVDERTLREMYLPPFEAAVSQAQPGAIMAAYNRVNGTFMTENRYLLRDVLKKEFGFQGFVISDSLALHNTTGSIKGGTDMEAPQSMFYQPAVLVAAVTAKLIPKADIDEAVSRILKTMFRFGMFDRKAYAPEPLDVEAGFDTARKIAEAGIVLLSNKGILPISPQIRSIAVIGKPTTKHPVGGGSGSVNAVKSDTSLAAITARAGEGIRVTHSNGSNVPQATALAAQADLAIVFAADIRAEGVDRACLSLDCSGRQDDLIRQVVAVNANTIVVLETGGPVLTPWRDDVAAIVQAWYPGEAGGSAIAAILFGDVNPSGHLPVTMPKRAEDTPTFGNAKAYPGDMFENATYKEGLFVGYRHYDKNKIEPAFPFGHGLSYTTFNYSNLSVSGTGNERNISLTATNTGKRSGATVVQLYVGLPSLPGVEQAPAQLKDFAKITLEPSQSSTVSLSLDARAFSYWDVLSSNWKIMPGCYQLMAGQSSRDLPLRTQIALGDAKCEAGN